MLGIRTKHGRMFISRYHIIERKNMAEQPVKNILRDTMWYLRNEAKKVNGKKLPRKMSPHRGHYASAQSIVVGNKRYGSCPRETYYSRVHPELAADIDNEDELSMMGMFGEVLNDVMVDATRKLGVYIDHEYEFAQEDGYWSGRADILCYSWKFDDNMNLIVDRSKMVVIENKTVKGYYGPKLCIFPDKGIYEPKKEVHVLQVSLYLDKLTREGMPMVEAQLWYMARDEGTTGTHFVNIVYDSEKEVRKIIVNGVWYKGFTIDAVNLESNKLRMAVDEKKIPERAYQLQYPAKKLTKMLHNDLLNKKDTNLVEKEEFCPKGDMTCTYCKWKNECWKDISILDQWADEDDTMIETL